MIPISVARSPSSSQGPAISRSPQSASPCHPLDPGHGLLVFLDRCRLCHLPWLHLALTSWRSSSPPSIPAPLPLCVCELLLLRTSDQTLLRMCNRTRVIASVLIMSTYLRGSSLLCVPNSSHNLQVLRRRGGRRGQRGVGGGGRWHLGPLV